MLENLDTLERQVSQLEYDSCRKETNQDVQQLLPQCKYLEEYLLQLALQVDGLQISRESAQKAFREKRQEEAKEITKLLSQRKKTNQRVQLLLKRLDTVVANLS